MTEEEEKKNPLSWKIIIIFMSIMIIILIYIWTIPPPEGYDPNEIIPRIIEVDCKTDQIGIEVCQEICINDNDHAMLLPKEDCGLK